MPPPDSVKEPVVLRKPPRRPPVSKACARLSEKNKSSNAFVALPVLRFPERAIILYSGMLYRGGALPTPLKWGNLLRVSQA